MAKVVVLGDAASSALLLREIWNYSSLCENHVSVGVLNEPERTILDHGYSVLIPVSNKYFSAELKMCVYDDVAMRELVSETRDDIQVETEGVILVMPQNGEFDQDSDLAKAGAKLAETDCSLRLVAFYKSDGSIPLQLMEWSLDHGYECIQRDKENPTFGWNDREKDGLPRIMEAFQTQMWSSMVRREESRPFTLRTPAAMASTTTEVSVSITSSQEVIIENVDQTRDSGNVNESNIDQQPCGVGEPDKTSAEEESMDNFNDLLTAARNIRDEAHRGNLSDEERRRRAADMAMKLCAMMNLDENDDEDADADSPR